MKGCFGFSYFEVVNFPSAGLHNKAFSAGGGLVGVLRLLNLTDEQLECFGYVLAVPGTSFGPRAVVLVSERLALLGCHLALLRAEVALVADDADGNGLSALRGGC